ncbi:MAG: S24/S26 family peptidase [Methanoregula sp.]|nr:S24/S26 family peptidase [Methanoregula sp.]
MSFETPDSYVRAGNGITFTSEVRLELTKAVMEKGKPFRFSVFGSSMYPFIRDRHIITITPLPEGRPELGDVVAFVKPGVKKLFVHRVVRIGAGLFQLRGDNAKAPDGMVSRANIIGIVTRVEHNSSDVRAGLGRERRLVAVMSRHGLLWRITRVTGFLTTSVAAGLQKTRLDCQRGDSRE